MKSKVKQLFIVVLTANILAAGAYFFAFGYIKSQTQALSVLMNKIDLSDERNSRINELRAIVNQTQDERTQIGSFLLASSSEVSFIEQVEDLAKQSGLGEKTSNISQTPGPVASTKYLQISTGVTGSWSDVMYFLNQLENLPYEIHIRNISLTQQTASVQTGSGKKISTKTVTVWAGSFDISVVENI